MEQGSKIHDFGTWGKQNPDVGTGGNKNPYFGTRVTELSSTLLNGITLTNV